jgi:iron complex transport system ATP-binding protein
MGRFAHIKFGRVPGRADVAAMEGALEEMRIGHLADRRFQELSGGERQLTLMARALAQNAMILLLDEPTANLDFANQGAVLNMVKKIAKIGRSVLMTTHFPNHAFVAADQTALIKSGRILACGPTEDVLTGQSLSAIYGTKIAVVSAQIPGYGLEVKLCAPIPEEG